MGNQRRMHLNEKILAPLKHLAKHLAELAIVQWRFHHPFPVLNPLKSFEICARASNLTAEKVLTCRV